MSKEKETPVVEKAPKAVSAAKKAALDLIEAYKVQNPAKYELRKAELQKWVESID